MAIWEIFLISLLCGALVASLGVSAYLEIKRYRKYAAMLRDQQLFYRECIIWIHADLYERGLTPVDLMNICDDLKED